MAKYKYDLLLMTQPKTLLQEGAIMMDHHLLFMTRSSSTNKSLINGHLQEECQQQEMIMHSLYFPPLEISAAPKSLL